jgi:hypothetical protein
LEVQEHTELGDVLGLVLDGHVRQQAPVERLAGELLANLLRRHRHGDATEDAALLVERRHLRHRVPYSQGWNASEAS